MSEQLPYYSAPLVRGYIGPEKAAKTTSIDAYLVEKALENKQTEEKPTKPEEPEEKAVEPTAAKPKKKRIKKALTALLLTGGIVFGFAASDTNNSTPDAPVSPGISTPSEGATTPAPQPTNPDNPGETPPTCTQIPTTTIYKASGKEYVWNIAKKLVGERKQHKPTAADTPDVNIVAKLITDENRNNPQLRDGIDKGDTVIVPSSKATNVIFTLRKQPPTSTSSVTDTRLYTNLNRLNMLTDGATRTQQTLVQQIQGDLKTAVQIPCRPGHQR